MAKHNSSSAGNCHRDVAVRRGSNGSKGSTTANRRSSLSHHENDVVDPNKLAKKYQQNHPRKRRLSTPSKSSLRGGNSSSQGGGRSMNRRGSNDTAPTACSNSDYFDLPVKDEKTVRFKTRLEKRKRVLSRHQMSPSEHNEYWFQPYEYDAIERRNLRIIDKIEHSYEDNHGNIVVAFRHKHMRRYSNQYNNSKPSCLKGQQDAQQPPLRRRRRPSITNCPRGLEKGLKNEYRTSAAYKITALEAVAWEQDRQFREGIRDDIAIANAYKKISRKCLFRARTRALLDQKEVEKFMKDGDNDGDDYDEEDEDYEYDLGYNASSSRRPVAVPGRHNRLKAAVARLFAAPRYDDSVSTLTTPSLSSYHSDTYKGRPIKQYRSIDVR